MTEAVRVGLLDSGVGPGLARRVAASRAFVAGPDGAIAPGAAGADRLGHGTELARIILAAAPDARLVNAQVFVASMAAPAAAVAAGLDWLVAQGVHLVNMSFGLRRDREVLRRACTGALDAGVVLVTAAPARGPAVFPAAYAGVIRVCGDARCAVGEVSALGTAQADFGAHPRPLPGGPPPGDGLPPGGASFAAAHLTGFLARHPALAAGSAADRRRRALEHLERSAAYRGPERRTATACPDPVMMPTAR